MLSLYEVAIEVDESWDKGPCPRCLSLNVDLEKNKSGERSRCNICGLRGCYRED